MENLEDCFEDKTEPPQRTPEIASGQFYLSKQEAIQGAHLESLLVEIWGNCIVVRKVDSRLVGTVFFGDNLLFEMNFMEKNNARSPMLGFTIINGPKAVSFYHQDQLLMRKWWGHLIGKINHRGFANLFRKSMKIGQGAYSSVHMASSLLDDRKMAIKCVQKQALRDDQSRRKLLLFQIESMRRCNHQNVNKLYGVFQSETEIYQVLELIDCGQLAYRFQSNYKFSSFEIKLIMEGLLKGLQHIHSKGIMHRDIKPENIMFRTKSVDSEVVIVDFGLAVPCDADDYVWYRCGTPGYIAPEVLRNKSYKRLDPVVDIFSVGSIFFRMLFQRPLFLRKSHNELLESNAACDFQLDDGSCNPNFTTATFDLLRKMLDTNPHSRITAGEALTHPFFKESNIFKSNICPTQQEEQVEEDSYVSRLALKKNSSQSPSRSRYSAQKVKKYQQLKLRLDKKTSFNNQGKRLVSPVAPLGQQLNRPQLVA